MSDYNRPIYVKSPPLPTSENHSYVNLNQSHTGARLPSYIESNHNSFERPSLTTPRSKSLVSLEINNNIKPEPNSNTHIPQNWYSPPSSIRSDSRAPSIFNPRANAPNGYSKIYSKTSRPDSMASYQPIHMQPKLHTINEDLPVLPLDKLLQLCVLSDDDIQANAFGYLQHLTFNNPDIKMEVKEIGGLSVIIENIDSANNYVARAALGVLKNMAFSELEMITTEIANHNAINKLAKIIADTEDSTQKELAIDVLWNLSVKYNLKPLILSDVIETLMNSVIIPDSGLIREERGNYVQGEEETVWSTMLRNALGIIRNVSYESYEARAALRDVDGLVDCILYIIFQAGNRQEEEEQENQLALIDTKIVENCVCILRNLTYAIQEIIDPDYSEKRRNNVQKPKKIFKSKSSADQTVMMAPSPSSGIPKGPELLWNSKYVVTTLFPILKNAANAVTLEAAAGVTQNLTAGDWEPSKDMEIQFRLQLALPTLIELVEFGTNEVIRSAATALRNLVQEDFCRMLVGKNGLQCLTDKIPMSNHSKSSRTIEPASLAALLSTIYVIISDEVEFMKNFVDNKGAQRCIFVKNSDEFIINDDPFPDKVRVFSHCILDLLWRKTETQSMLKKANIKAADITISNTKSTPESPENNIRYHMSIVSDGIDGMQGRPKDQRYQRDSFAEIVSNSGLKNRHSMAYTVNSVPGYGDIRVPVQANANGRLGTIQSSSNASSIVSSPNKIQKNPGSYNYGYRTTPIASPIPMKPIHGKVSIDNRRPSNNSSNQRPQSASSKNSNRPVPTPRPINNRLSSSTNNSEMYNYGYSKPNKPKPISNNSTPTHRLSNKGV